MLGAEIIVERVSVWLAHSCAWRRLTGEGVWLQGTRSWCPKELFKQPCARSGGTFNLLLEIWEEASNLAKKSRVYVSLNSQTCTWAHCWLRGKLHKDSVPLRYGLYHVLTRKDRMGTINLFPPLHEHISGMVFMQLGFMERGVRTPDPEMWQGRGRSLRGWESQQVKCCRFTIISTCSAWWMRSTCSVGGLSRSRPLQGKFWSAKPLWSIHKLFQNETNISAVICVSTLKL